MEYSEDAYYPVHGDWEDDGFEGRGITVKEMISTIASVLDVKLPPEVLYELTVYYSSDLYFMDIISDIPELKSHIRVIKDKIKRDEGFLLEYYRSGRDNRIIYLTNSNINMAAEEAAHFVNSVLRGRMKTHLKPFDRFYRNVVTECLGFFGSKFINEKRKSQSEYSLRKFLGQVKRGEHDQMEPEYPQAARCILQHFYLQKKTSEPDEFKKKFHMQYGNRSSIPTIFSTQMGYMLGNKLYYAVKRGTFPLEKVRKLFYAPLNKQMQGFECFLEISKRLKKVKTVEQY